MTSPAHVRPRPATRDMRMPPLPPSQPPSVSPITTVRDAPSALDQPVPPEVKSCQGQTHQSGGGNRVPRCASGQLKAPSHPQTGPWGGARGALGGGLPGPRACANTLGRACNSASAFHVVGTAPFRGGRTGRVPAGGWSRHARAGHCAVFCVTTTEQGP